MDDRDPRIRGSPVISGRAWRTITLAAVAWSCSAPRDAPPVRQPSGVTVPGVAGGSPNASLDAAIARAESIYLRSAFDSARPALARALASARESRDSVNEGRALTLLGLTAWRTADFALARSLGEQALALKLRLGRGIELSKSYNALGLLAWDEGRHCWHANKVRGPGDVTPWISHWAGG